MSPVAEKKTLNKKNPKNLISREGSSSSKSQIINQGRGITGAVREPPTQTRLLHGPFVIYPGFGTVQPGQNVTVVIDCAVEQVKKHEEFLAIEISDRDPDDNPGGIPYKLLSEGCMPTIDVNSIHQVFEEQRVVQSSLAFQSIQSLNIQNGIFGIDENKFVFPNVVIGRVAHGQIFDY